MAWRGFQRVSRWAGTGATQRSDGKSLLAPFRRQGDATEPERVEPDTQLLERHPAILSARLNAGAVYLSLKADADPASFDLKVGSQSMPFRPVWETPLGPDAPARRIRFDAGALCRAATPMAPTIDRRVVEAKVNAHHDWSLSGADTMQLMIAQPDAPFALSFGAPLFVDGRGATTAPSFQAYLGMHRAEAELRVRFLNLDTGAETVETCAFDPAILGGQRPEAYQAISLAPKEIGAQWRITMEVQFHRAVDDGTGIAPFLFIADPRIQFEADPDEAIYTHVIADRESQEPSITVAAPLPPISSFDEAIRVAEGNTETSLLQLPPLIVTLTEDKGHTLVLQSSDAFEAVICVDGEPIEAVALGQGQTVLRLPIEALTGTRHQISLMDHTGSFTVFGAEIATPSVTTDYQTLQRETLAPTPAAASPMTPRRYDSLRAHLSERTGIDPHLLARALEICEAGHETPHLAPLAFAEVADPVVSVIIPVHNQFAVTMVALASLILAPNRVPYEVIVVDDGSEDETCSLTDHVSGITVIRHDRPQRFIRACRAGVEAARGDYFVFLNNDVEVTAHWLDHLLDGFNRFAKVGLTGAKLTYPDGKLQEAGGLIWRNGNPWNYGNRANPLEPRFNYARQADYLSGAALMVSRHVWEKVGGFSAEFEPMYFEDTDLAFKVRAAGYSTWYIPSAEVIHYEGITSGTDVTTGLKRTQETNRPKFKEKWAGAFVGFGPEGQDPDHEKDRGVIGRILVVDYSTPRPDRDAGSYAALQEIRLLQSLGYKLTFLPTNMAHLGSYTEAMQRDGIEVIYGPFTLSPAEFIAKRGAEFDAIYATRHYVAKDVIERMARINPKAKRIYNVADLHFLREMRTARAHDDSALLDKARQTRAAEVEAMTQSDLVLTYSDAERAVIEAVTEGAVPAAVCPWVVDLPDAAPPPRQTRAGLSFLGSFNHHPNPEALDWFLAKVLPNLNAGLPLHVYGASMPDAWRLRGSDQVRMTGFVKDVSEAFDPHIAFLAPLRSGAGIKGKVISAMAHGLPCILTPVAAEGMPVRDGTDCLIADTPQAWADAIEALVGDDALWAALSQAARQFVQTHFSFAAGQEKMRAALRHVDMIPPRVQDPRSAIRRGIEA